MYSLELKVQTGLRYFIVVTTNMDLINTIYLKYYYSSTFFPNITVWYTIDYKEILHDTVKYIITKITTITIIFHK